MEDGNPNAGQVEHVSSKPPKTKWRKCWFPIFSAVLHTISLIWFWLENPPITDPESEMTWIAWFAIDFPLSLFTVVPGTGFSSEIAALLYIAIPGAILFAAYAYILQTLLGWLLRVLLTSK